MSTGRAGRDGPGAPRLPRAPSVRGRGGARCHSSPGLPRPPPRRGALPAGCHFTSALPGPGAAAALPRTVPGRAHCGLSPAGAGPGPGSLGSLVVLAELPGRDGAAALLPAILARPTGWGALASAEAGSDSKRSSSRAGAKLAGVSPIQPLTVWVLNRINQRACCSFALSIHRTSLSCLHTTCYQTLRCLFWSFV